MSSKFLVVDPGVMASDGDLHFVAKGSTKYGGFTVVDAWATVGGATNAGTSFRLVLQNYGISGTVAGGTVGTVGGTTDPFAADTPKQFALTDANVFIDAGEWLVLKKVEQNDSDLNAESSIIIEIVDGVVTQG